MAEKNSVKFCPKCGGINVNLSGLGLIKGFWKCNDCGYQAANFPEKNKIKINKK